MRVASRLKLRLRKSASGPVSVQHLLHDVNVQPSAELAPHFFERPHPNEAGALIKVDALLASLRDPRDERMKPQPARLLNGRLFQLSTDAPAAKLRLHV